MTLAEWLAQEGKNDAWLAKQIGRERSFISKVRRGKTRPSISTAARICQLSQGKVRAEDYGEMNPFLVPEWRF